MTINVPIDLAYEFDVKASPQVVFSLLADVPASASHFPKLAKLLDLGGNAYQWEMKRIGAASLSIQTVYACQYVSDKKAGSIIWSPVAGVGNASISGSWAISKAKKGTHLVLESRGNLQVSLPGLMKAMVAPMVIEENDDLISTYIENLTKHFGG